MTYAKILVPLTGSPTDATALNTAFSAAKPFGSHVGALFVHPDPREPMPYMYSQMRASPVIIQSVIDGQAKIAKEAAAAARSSLAAAAKDFGATETDGSATKKGTGTSSSFEERYGFIPHLVHEAARYADLVVFKPMVADERPEFASALADTLVKANRPVLLSPQTPRSDIGRHIVLAWDGGDAAAHAATAALPFLKGATKVDILAVQYGEERPVPGTGAIRGYLALHGVNVELRRLTHDRQNLGAFLMDAAAGAGADMIVMGGYGHSRLRETVFGGVTVDMISHPALPVFLMH